MLRIIFLAVIVAVNCKPQLRAHRPSPPQTFGPAVRQPTFVNAAPAPIHDSVPRHVPHDQAHHKSFIQDKESEDYEIFQNENAMYQFASDIEDHINDLTHRREETRDGSTVKGSYSYSDGYFKRTVNYIADENGYRVTGMEAIPLDGPHIDLMGTASVSNSAHGAQLKYKVASISVPGPIGKIVDQL